MNYAGLRWQFLGTTPSARPYPSNQPVYDADRKYRCSKLLRRISATQSRIDRVHSTLVHVSHEDPQPYTINFRVVKYG
ncbi:hypothetical protein PsYK624_123570 [Phanerochaete sordida]|uniref:Uncharacterized protein n=1 Tax=Phanerochaete sordida TaxID=48140 RepID=A0A9P3GKY0_9APHY|nr:hypothetical protein PsYK624_123570 [Phanerochaete sordida]